MPRATRCAGQDIPDDIILGMKDHPNFLGVKECTGERAGAASVLGALIVALAAKWGGKEGEKGRVVHAGQQICMHAPESTRHVSFSLGGEPQFHPCLLAGSPQPCDALHAWDFFEGTTS